MERLHTSNTGITDTIKVLIYKENPTLLEKLDFEDEGTFMEPLLFAYFNGKNKNDFSAEMLEEIMQGYIMERRTVNVIHSYNTNGVVYIPNRGYFIEGKEEPIDEIAVIKNTTIELIRHPIKLLDTIFRDFQDNPIPATEINVSKSLVEQYEQPLTNALQFIKKGAPNHFELIERCCKKVVLFKTSPKNTNSFATINAHGIAFLNAYQDKYDEVFFVDDIAHQTGHIILTTLCFERKKYFKIDENEAVENMINEPDHRNFYILIHALYTYYASITCLQNCLEEKLFDERQTWEAIGRIGFYHRKYAADIIKLNKCCTQYGGKENTFEKQGLDLYTLLYGKFIEFNEKWSETVRGLNYSNQPYNFTYSKFIALNPQKPRKSLCKN